MTDAGHGMAVVFTLTTPVGLAVLRQEIAKLVRRRGLPIAEPDLDAVQLVATELATNALEHAEPPYEVRVGYDEGRSAMVIEVDDGSPGARPTVGRSSVDELRGRGLVLIAQLAEWGTRIRTGRKTVWARLPRPAIGSRQGDG